LNIQYAIAEGKLHVIEAKPAGLAYVPFVSKATGVPLPRSRRADAGEKLAEQDLPRASRARQREGGGAAFARFAGADSVLGPEMKSTGEVMASPPTSRPLRQAQAAAGVVLPSEGSVFITVTDTTRRRDAAGGAPPRRRLPDHRHRRHGDGDRADGVPVRRINSSTRVPHVLDLIRKRECDL